MRVKKVVLCVLMFILIFSINFTSVKAIEEGDGEIKISYGLDGILRDGSSVPIAVEVNNKKGEVLKGNIEIIVPDSFGTKSSFNEEIEVEGKGKETFYIPVDIGNFKEKITVKLSSDNKVIDTKETIISNESIVIYPELLVGVLSDSSSKLEFLEEFETESNMMWKKFEVQVKRTRVANLNKDVFESNLKNFKFLDVIIINDFDTAKLSKESIKNINKWVDNGGTLILGGTENTLNNLPKDILDKGIQNYKDHWVKIGDDKGLNLTLGSLTGNLGDEETKFNQSILAEKYIRKNGRIIVTSFDLGSENLKKFEYKNEVLANILSREEGGYIGSMNTSSGYSSSLEAILKSIPFTKEFPIKILIMIFVIYILSTGFGGYFLLKKLDKREWLWVVIPALSLIFTITLSSVSKGTSIGDMAQVEVNKVEIDEYGNGSIESYLSVANKYKRDITINEPEGITMEYVENGANDSRQDLVGESSDKISSKIFSDGANTRYEFSNVSALEFKCFNLRGKQGKFNKVDGDLNYQNHSITGKITNNLGADVIKSYIIFGDMVWDVGPISKGEILDFNNFQPNYDDGIYGVLPGSGYSYEDKYLYLEREEKNENLMKNFELLRYAAEDINRKELMIVSITNDSIDYGLTFNSKDIMKFSNTVYINPLNVDFKDNEGNIVYPEHLIEKNIVSKTEYMSDDTDTIYGRGELVLGYTLPENFKAKEIQIYIAKSGIDDIGGYIKFNTYSKGAQIYNFKTEKFEDINLSKDNQISIKNLSNYIKDGTFRIKYFGDDEYQSVLPKVAIVGRYSNASN